jgi:hypothetical protein
MLIDLKVSNIKDIIALLKDNELLEEKVRNAEAMLRM